MQHDTCHSSLLSLLLEEIAYDLSSCCLRALLCTAVAVVSYHLTTLRRLPPYLHMLYYYYYCCTQQVAARVHAVSEILLPLSVINTAVRQHYTEFLCAMANDARWMVSRLLLQLLEHMNI
jgi:hypothetical protein